VATGRTAIGLIGRKPLVGLLAGATALAIESAASAQSAPPVLPDERAVDFDAPAEQFSDFWERALQPNQSDYEAKLARADALLVRTSDATLYPEAGALLDAAVALRPSDPRAWWLLGVLHERNHDWAACVDVRQHVFELDPSYRPARAEAWELERGLGDCLARAGRSEDAVERYKRILSSGDARGSYAHLYLGLAYMALGRVDEAIEAYVAGLADVTVNPRARLTAFMHVAAAVAFDRDGQRAAAAEQMGQALRIDRTLSVFDSPQAQFAPAEEALYYRAFAEEARERDAWAIAYYRRYLRASGDKGWRDRATAHLAALESRSFDAGDLRITGSALMDRRAAQAAVMKRAAALHACMHAIPGALLELRISVTVAAGHKPRELVVPEIQVDQAGDELETGDAIDTARACVLRTAATLALPRPVGPPQSYAAVELWLVAR
jgi:tetratricopeptide (TPR) repeat protein